MDIILYAMSSVSKGVPMEYLSLTPYEHYPGDHSVVEAIFVKELAVWVYAFSLNVYSI